MSRKIKIYFNLAPFEIYKQTAEALRIREGYTIKTWVDYCYIIRQDSLIGLKLMRQYFRM